MKPIRTYPTSFEAVIIFSSGKCSPSAVFHTVSEFASEDIASLNISGIESQRESSCSFENLINMFVRALSRRQAFLLTTPRLRRARRLLALFRKLPPPRVPRSQAYCWLLFSYNSFLFRQHRQHLSYFQLLLNLLLPLQIIR